MSIDEKKVILLKKTVDTVKSLNKPPLLSAPVKPTLNGPMSSPDLSENFIAPYNKLEKEIQGIENVNNFLQNSEFAINVASKLTPKIRPVSGKSDIIQKVLWATDAARALTDSEYRAQADTGFGNIVDSDLKGSDLFFQALKYASQRPIAFGGATLRSIQGENKSNREQDLERVTAKTDSKIEQKKQELKSRILPHGHKMQEAKLFDANKNMFNILNEDAFSNFAKQAFAPEQVYGSQIANNAL
jgi:hypothetical protein